MSDLNEQQQAVVAAPSEGVVQVRALAGTGKSHTLIHRANTLLIDNYHRLLLLAFNKRIQLEMQDKVRTKLGAIAPRIDVQTSHAFSLRMVRENFQEHLKHLIKANQLEILEADYKVEKLAEELIKEKRFILSKRIMKPIIKALIAVGNLYRSVDTQDFQRLIGRYFKILKPLQEVGVHDFMPLVKEIYNDRYCRGQLAFSDMIPLAVQLPQACFNEMKYTYIMVDEAQDLNLVQHKLVQMLYSSAKGLTIVGDEFQSIYSFNGAAPHVFIEMPQSYGAKVYPIEYNYRSSPEILSFANTVLRDNLESSMFLKPGKNLTGYPQPWILPNNKSLMDWLHYITVQKSIPSDEIAILYRANKQCLPIELAMINHKIPYQSKSGGFFTVPAVKDMLAYMMLFLQPSEEWWKIVIGHRKYLGKATADTAYFMDSRRPWKTKPSTLQSKFMLSAWADLGNFMDDCERKVQRGTDIPTYAFQIHRMLGEYWQEKYADDPDELEDALETANAVLSWLSSLGTYEELTAVFTARKELNSDEGIVLSTIHKAKGLEWDAVMLHGCGDQTFIKHCADNWPEEYRLAYVAFTRAKKYLTLAADLSDPTGGVLCAHLRSVLYKLEHRGSDAILDWKYDELYDPAYVPQVQSAAS